jgi:hypothetical protein
MLVNAFRLGSRSVSATLVFLALAAGAEEQTQVATLGPASGAQAPSAAKDPAERALDVAMERIRKSRELIAARAKQPAELAPAYELLRQANELLVRAAFRNRDHAGGCALLKTHASKAAEAAQAYLRAHQEAAAVRSVALTPLTEAERAALASFFPKRLLAAVKILEAEHAGFFNDASGVTLGAELVVLRPGARTLGRLKHELAHACQHQRLGVLDFAKAYLAGHFAAGCDQSSNSMEAYAEAFERAASATGIASSLWYCQ